MAVLFLVPIIPIVMCQGKTIITEPTSPVVMTTSGVGGGDGGGNGGGEANSPPVGMEVMADLVADLMCCVCGRMTAAAEPDSSESNKVPITNNVLVECTRCRSLYHQLCHTPPVLTSPAPPGWLCAKCSDASASTTPSSSSSLRRPVTSGPTDLSIDIKKPKK